LVSLSLLLAFGFFVDSLFFFFVANDTKSTSFSHPVFLFNPRTRLLSLSLSLLSPVKENGSQTEDAWSTLPMTLLSTFESTIESFSAYPIPASR